jgi:hypothetical protein
VVYHPTQHTHMPQYQHMCVQVMHGSTPHIINKRENEGTEGHYTSYQNLLIMLTPRALAKIQHVHPHSPVTVPPPSPPTTAAAPAISGTYACRGARGGAGVTPALTRCAQEEQSRAGVGRASSVADEDEGLGWI